MSLTFGAATTDRIVCGTGASISNLPEWTYLAWVYPTTFTSLRTFYSRSDINYIRLNGTAGYIQILRGYSTTSMNYIANSRALTLNAWNFVAGRMTTAQTGNLYTGTLTTPADECTYSTSNAGVGTLSNDDVVVPGIAANIGNLQGVSRAFQGTIAILSVWRYAMPIWYIRDQQRNPRPGPGCVAFWRLGGRYGKSTQYDESGYGNHGTTVTGTAASTLEPPLYIPPPRQRIWYVPEVVVGATAVPVFYRHLQTQGIA